MDQSCGCGGALLTARILVVAQTASTNSDLLALAAAGAEEGLWLRAEVQTAGKGRQGRRWSSEPGNLFASTLVRTGPSDPPATGLAFVAALAAHGTVAAVLPAATRPVIKWPNDILVGDAKLCGILLEGQDNIVVAGFGINVAHAPLLADRPATSLAASGAASGLTAGDVAERLADHFAYWAALWRRDGLAPVLSAWSAAAQPLGTPLRAHLPDGQQVAGVFDGLAPDGALLMRLADGARHVIHAGDIFPI